MMTAMISVICEHKISEETCPNVNITLLACSDDSEARLKLTISRANVRIPEKDDQEGIWCLFL